MVRYTFSWVSVLMAACAALFAFVLARETSLSMLEMGLGSYAALMVLMVTFGAVGEAYKRRALGIKPLGKLLTDQQRDVQIKGSKDVVFDQVIRAIERIGHVSSSDRKRGVIEGKTWRSLWSSGEALKVTIREAQDEESYVSIHSGSLRRGQRYDSGKSRINVQQIANELIMPTQVDVNQLLMYGVV